MHLIMILAALGFAWVIRISSKGILIQTALGTYTTERFSQILVLFLFPPLLLFITGVAVLCMGPEGEMVGFQAGWWSYWLTTSFLGWLGVRCCQLGWQGWQSFAQVSTYPTLTWANRTIRVFDTTIPFAAQIGFWQPELVVSKGLLDTLDSSHLDAVIAHEEAHYHYRDTFWFFWLGWVRSCTTWLPYTESLWQELLVIRELRADHWAAQQVDPLLLAESLLVVVSAPLLQSQLCAAFSAVAQRSRLAQRIDALLGKPDTPHHLHWWWWVWFLPAFVPLMAVPFHN